MYIPFDQMPAESRVWVFSSDRKLGESELMAVGEKLQAFCEQWNSHGAALPTSFDIRYDQVLILCVDERQLGASGCSIDSSVRILKDLEQSLGVNLLDQGKVSLLKSGNQLEILPFSGIKSKVASGDLSSETLMLNPTVAKKSDLETTWITSAANSWLGRYFQN